MNNVLINACGIKSLGGINVLESSIKNIKKNSNVQILVSDRELEKRLSSGGINNIVVEQKPRFTHPFLLLFVNKDLRDWVNSFDATIHFGNFGFKTKTKDIVFIQNILPYSNRSMTLKNLLLRYFINKSIKFSSIAVVQNEHVIDYLPPKFRSKVISIGKISQTNINTSRGKGIIAISNTLPYKNIDFIENVMDNLSEALNEEYKLTLITEKNRDMSSSKVTYISSLSSNQVKAELKKHSIYFHASSVETLCLPIFEAQENGLMVVAPNLDYALNAVHEKKYLYKYQDSSNAIDSIHSAVKDLNKINSLTINVYSESWKEILK